HPRGKGGPVSCSAGESRWTGHAFVRGGGHRGLYARRGHARAPRPVRLRRRSRPLFRQHRPVARARPLAAEGSQRASAACGQRSAAHRSRPAHIRRSLEGNARGGPLIATRARVIDQPKSAWTRPLLGPHVRAAAPVLACTLVVSVLFGLPHVLIPRILGDQRPYTPFAISSVSALTYDETSSYAAYVNYVARRWTAPYDTDVFENRDIPLHASFAPYFAVAGLASLVGGVEPAFIICDFLLPPIGFLVLVALLLQLTRSRAVALFGASTVLLVAFGPRNFLEVPFKLVSNRGDEVVQPLEYSRLMHPEFSFTLFASALLVLWLAL